MCGSHVMCGSVHESCDVCMCGGDDVVCHCGDDVCMCGGDHVMCACVVVML